MKKMNIVITMVAIVICVFYACKKSDTTKVELNNKSKEAFIERIRKLNEGMVFSLQVNQKQDIQFYDKSGNAVTKKEKSTISVAGNNIHETAIWNCGFPGDVPDPIATLQTVTNMYSCGDGYKYTFEYLVSMPMNMVSVSSIAPYTGKTSSGSITLTNTTGTVYTESKIPVTTELIGDDPNNPELFLYRVTFTCSTISSSVVQSAFYIKGGITLYTDCPEYPYAVANSPSQSLMYIPNGNILNDPCSRTDKCYFVSPRATPSLLIKCASIILRQQ